jgi:hypothetical protein
MWKSSFRCISAYSLIHYLPCYYPLHIIYFLHLLSTNRKCIEPCYFPLILKPAAQKKKMHWNSSIRSSRLCAALVAVPAELWSVPLFHFVRVVVVLRDNIYVIIILYSWHLVICEPFWSICVEQLIMRHRYDEYMVLLAKSGLTRSGTKAVSTKGMLA